MILDFLVYQKALLVQYLLLALEILGNPEDLEVQLAQQVLVDHWLQHFQAVLDLPMDLLVLVDLMDQLVQENQHHLLVPDLQSLLVDLQDLVLLLVQAVPENQVDREDLYHHDFQVVLMAQQVQRVQ